MSEGAQLSKHAIGTCVGTLQPVWYLLLGREVVDKTAIDQSPAHAA
ncbi:hypothetical protein ACFORO_41440 [Amycolatopsis halotolerans]|uniref:Uncharacterized protein n=1 Tax=Amycolatopsis halotolerans TaxID=330083 RepID=A0ABV7QTR5_9PSEU